MHLTTFKVKKKKFRGFWDSETKLFWRERDLYGTKSYINTILKKQQLEFWRLPTAKELSMLHENLRDKRIDQNEIRNRIFYSQPFSDSTDKSFALSEIPVRMSGTLYLTQQIYREQNYGVSEFPDVCIGFYFKGGIAKSDKNMPKAIKLIAEPLTHMLPDWVSGKKLF